MLTGELPLWSSYEARVLVDRRNPGGLVRLGRRQRGWRQSDLGERIGCSASTVSRLESSRRVADVDLLRAAATAVDVPSHILAAACGFSFVRPARTRVTTDAPRDATAEEDPMRRRR